MLKAILDGKIEEMNPGTMSAHAKQIVSEISTGTPRMGDLKRLAATIKTDHDLAVELWSTGDYYPRLLATLIFDKKRLTESDIDDLAADMATHSDSERDQLTDWFLANQLSKDKRLVALMETWESHPSPIMRRLFWYHQARLRWTGQTPPANSADLMDVLEEKLATAESGVQWAMNFCAGQIGIHEPQYRSRCIQLGEKLGLYKGDHVSKNCTPNYLPEFIRIEVAKRT